MMLRMAAVTTLLKLSKAKRRISSAYRGGCTESGSSVLQIVEIHDGLVAMAGGEHGDGRATGDDGLKVVPTSDDATTVTVNEFTKRNTHLFFDHTGVVDVSANGKYLASCFIIFQ